MTDIFSGNNRGEWVFSRLTGGSSVMLLIFPFSTLLFGFCSGEMRGFRINNRRLNGSITGEKGK